MIEARTALSDLDLALGRASSGGAAAGGRTAAFSERYLTAVRLALAKLIDTSAQSGIIAITSPRRGDGRSSLAAAAAGSLAALQSGRTILVDADFERPRQASLFGLEPEPGLAGYLDGSERLTLQSGTADGRLAVLVAGSGGGRSSRLQPALLGSGLLDALGARSRWTVVDCPPLLESPDAAPLVRRADHRILVGVYRRTDLRDLEACVDAIGGPSRAGFFLAGCDSRFPGWARRVS